MLKEKVKISGPLPPWLCCRPPRWLPVRLYARAGPCSSTARLFCQGGVMHMLRTVRNKTHDTEALVHACSAWAGRGSKNTQLCCSERDVGNGILLGPAHSRSNHTRVTERYCVIPALQEIRSGSREKKCGVMTSTTASHYRGNAVIVTALYVY